MVDRDRLYERVRSVCPIGSADFDEDYACALRELCALFGAKYVYSNAAHTAVYEEYEPALSSEILFYLRGEEDDRRRFLLRAEDAYRAVWRAKADENRKEKET